METSGLTLIDLYYYKMYTAFVCNNVFICKENTINLIIAIFALVVLVHGYKKL